MSTTSFEYLRNLRNKEAGALINLIYAIVGPSTISEVQKLVEKVCIAFKEVKPNDLRYLKYDQRIEYEEIRDRYFKLLDDIAIYCTRNIRALGDLTKSKTRGELKIICDRLDPQGNEDMQRDCGELRSRLIKLQQSLQSSSSNAWKHWLGATIACLAVVAALLCGQIWALPIIGSNAAGIALGVAIAGTAFSAAGLTVTSSITIIESTAELQEKIQKCEDQLKEIQCKLSEISMKTPFEDDPVDEKCMESLKEIKGLLTGLRLSCLERNF